MSEGHNAGASAPESATFDDQPGMTQGEMCDLLRGHLKLSTIGPLAAGVMAMGVAFVVPPNVTASTTLLPQSQNAGAATVASLHSLEHSANRPYGETVIHNSAGQCVAMLPKLTVSDLTVGVIASCTVCTGN